MLSKPSDWPPARRGCVFYDAQCAFCRRQVGRLERLAGPGVLQFLPLQFPGVAERLGIARPDLEAQLHLLLRDGQRLGGSDALLELAGWFPLTRPLAWLGNLPGIRALLRRVYFQIARRRHCLGGSCQLSHHPHETHRVFFELP